MQIAFFYFLISEDKAKKSQKSSKYIWGWKGGSYAQSTVHDVCHIMPWVQLILLTFSLFSTYSFKFHPSIFHWAIKTHQIDNIHYTENKNASLPTYIGKSTSEFNMCIHRENKF